MRSEESKPVYFFGEGHKEMRRLLGGKGANLAEMTRLGLPVPFGFTITTACVNQHWLGKTEEHGEAFTRRLVMDSVKVLEERTGKHLGGRENPLFLSVRAGAEYSMPGMLETILNVGMNEQNILHMTKNGNSGNWIYTAYLSFIRSFGEAVFGVPHESLQTCEENFLTGKNAGSIRALETEQLVSLAGLLKAVIHEHSGKDIPNDAEEQLNLAIGAAAASWLSPNAVYYRRMKGIPEELGTAINIQEMVFGNRDSQSGTGVVFTRDPMTGAAEWTGEYLYGSQGTELVSGTANPRPLEDFKGSCPHLYMELHTMGQLLEKHYGATQDIEFTVESGRLYILQTREAVVTKKAAESLQKVFPAR
jgi:pyruvate, orthophosphate dikinase